MIRNESTRLLGLVNLELELTNVSLRNGWSKAIEEALTKDHIDAKAYWVEVRFTKHMIYLRSAPDKGQHEKNPQFTKTAVAPYKPRVKHVRVLNEKYFTRP
jgi:hypothetical protein